MKGRIEGLLDLPHVDLVGDAETLLFPESGFVVSDNLDGLAIDSAESSLDLRSLIVGPSPGINEQLRSVVSCARCSGRLIGSRCDLLNILLIGLAQVVPRESDDSAVRVDFNNTIDHPRKQTFVSSAIPGRPYASPCGFRHDHHQKNRHEACGEEFAIQKVRNKSLQVGVDGCVCISIRYGRLCRISFRPHFFPER